MTIKKLARKLKTTNDIAILHSWLRIKKYTTKHNDQIISFATAALNSHLAPSKLLFKKIIQLLLITDNSQVIEGFLKDDNFLNVKKNFHIILPGLINSKDFSYFKKALQDLRKKNYIVLLTARHLRDINIQDYTESYSNHPILGTCDSSLKSLSDIQTKYYNYPTIEHIRSTRIDQDIIDQYPNAFFFHENHILYNVINDIPYANFIELFSESIEAADIILGYILSPHLIEPCFHLNKEIILILSILSKKMNEQQKYNICIHPKNKAIQTEDLLLFFLKDMKKISGLPMVQLLNENGLLNVLNFYYFLVKSFLENNVYSGVNDLKAYLGDREMQELEDLDELSHFYLLLSTIKEITKRTNLEGFNKIIAKYAANLIQLFVAKGLALPENLDNGYKTYKNMLTFIDNNKFDTVEITDFSDYLENHSMIAMIIPRFFGLDIFSKDYILGLIEIYNIGRDEEIQFDNLLTVAFSEDIEESTLANLRSAENFESLYELYCEEDYVKVFLQRYIINPRDFPMSITEITSNHPDTIEDLLKALYINAAIPILREAAELQTALIEVFAVELDIKPSKFENYVAAEHTQARVYLYTKAQNKVACLIDESLAQKDKKLDSNLRAEQITNEKITSIYCLTNISYDNPELIENLLHKTSTKGKLSENFTTGKNYSRDSVDSSIALINDLDFSCLGNPCSNLRYKPTYTSSLYMNPHFKTVKLEYLDPLNDGYKRLIQEAHTLENIDTHIMEETLTDHNIVMSLLGGVLLYFCSI